MSFRLLLADDHTVVRQAIKSMLEQEGFDVVGEAWDGEQAVRLCSDLEPDVAVLDLSMPLLNGIDAARDIVGTCHHTKVVLLTMYAHDRYVFESLQLGVKGYVSKENTGAEVVEAIRAVCNGETYISRYVSTAVRNACLT